MKFHKRHKPRNLTQEEADNLNSYILIKELKLYFKISQTTPGLHGFTGEQYQTFREEIIPIVHKNLSEN